MQMCNTNESGGVDGRGTALLAHGHGNERDYRIDPGCGDLAAAVVALELGSGGWPRVAME
jgi:hypothetical protein